MAFYQYFQVLDDLLDPSGPLSASISSATIKDANEAVSTTRSKPEGKYAKFTLEQQAAIGEYASLDGNQAAIRHFTKKLEVYIKVTSFQTWKGEYLAEGGVAMHSRI